MLKAADPEVRCAAAMVLGRLRPVTEPTLRALKRAFAAAPRDTKAYFLDALAATKKAEVLDVVIPYLEFQGSLGEASVRVVHRFGKAALAPIARLHDGKVGWLSGAFIKAVASIRHPAAIDMLFDRLEDSTWEQARASSLFLRENWIRYPESVRAAVRRRLAARLVPAVDGDHPHPLVTCLKLAWEIEARFAVADILPHAKNRRHGAVCRHALQLLSTLEPTAEDRALAWPVLIDALRDVDWDDVAGPALDVLTAWGGPPPTIQQIRQITGSRHAGAVDFALRELARSDLESAKLEAGRLLELRTGPARQAAIHMLLDGESGRRTLIATLHSSEDDALRHDVAHALATSSRPMDDADIEGLIRSYPVRPSAADGDRPVLRLLAFVAREAFNRHVVERAEALMQAGDDAAAVDLLQPIVRQRYATEEARFTLGLANLHLSAGRVSNDHPQFQRCIGILAPLARTRGFNLTARLEAQADIGATERLALARALRPLGTDERFVADALLTSLAADDLAAADRAAWEALMHPESP